MSRYQRNRRPVSPASIAGPQKYPATGIFLVGSGNTLEINMGVVKPLQAAGANTSGYEPTAAEENVSLDPKHWRIKISTTWAEPVSVTILAPDFIAVEASGTVGGGAQVQYDGNDATLNAALGAKVPPFCQELPL